MAQAQVSLKSPTRRPLEHVERQSNFKVVVRVRPPLPRELSGELPFQNIIGIDEREQVITIGDNVESMQEETSQASSGNGPHTSHSYVFDHVYDPSSSQKKVYETTARGVVDSALQGYNATVFAYGQTGTGKTFTMEGFSEGSSGVEARGIIPRAIEQIFGHIQRHASPAMRFLVRASYLQIYNEAISDLLKPERSNLSIREDKKRGVFVDGLSEWVVRSPAEIYGLMQRGGAVRATGETKMNEVSSRSHAVFIVIVEQSQTIYVDERGQEMSPEEFQQFMHSRGVRREQDMTKLEDHVRQSFKVGKLNLVDLAGSERVRLSGATGQRLEESKQINRSLSALGNVISALTDTKGRTHVPYRDSKLTRMLEDSLGGNCRTTMMAMISPAMEAMVETLSTLKFANRAKNIKNEARVNEDLDQKSLLRKYERELKKLRAELEARSKNVVDKRKLLELDEQRRRAEADKMVAIKALEARSLEFMHEKEEKKRLEQRIAMLMGQMLKGDRTPTAVDQNHSSSSPQATQAPELQIIMKEQQDRLRQEYDGKLAEIERERETIEEEKAQVDRYKQLLLKQRDIMIALTQRLVERDEQIMALQDELDAYDRHQKELEEKLDEKTAMLYKFQRISLEMNASSPYKSDELTSALNESGTGVTNNPLNGATEIDLEGGAITSSLSRDSLSEMFNPSPTNSEGGATPSRDLTLLVERQRATIADLEDALRNARTMHGSIDSNSGATSPSLQTETAALNKVEDAIAVELEIHLSRLQGEGSVDGVGATLRQPMSSLMRQVLARVRTTRVAPDTQSMVQNIQQLGLEKLTAETRVQQLQQRLEKEEASVQQSAAISIRCDHLVKEREAVHTIMEQKIKVLVQSIAQSVGGVLQGGGPNAAQALTKDVAALQRLVNASIAALRNAASNDPLQTPAPAPPQRTGY